MTRGEDRHQGRDADDLYSTLGVPQDATSEDITRAYRRLAREHHPDANPAGDARRFSGITDAYDVLRDPGRRGTYDRTHRARAEAAHAASAVRIPVRRARSPSAEPSRTPTGPAGAVAPAVREIELALSFEQAALGTTALLQVSVDASCEICSGSGTTSSTCEGCGGAGSESRASGGVTIRHVCADCGGSGRNNHRCGACAGTGRRATNREVKLRVPAGVEDGTRLRFRVPGVDGTLEMVAVVRTAPHPYFGRRGRDLTVRLPVTLAEAALGGVLTVPTLAGAAAMRLPPGTPHGRTFRLRGRGIPHPSHPGDILVTVEVDVPTELNDQQKAALESFAAATEPPRRHFETPLTAGGDGITRMSGPDGGAPGTTATPGPVDAS
jgi:molecular chaperone DnaJ